MPITQSQLPFYGSANMPLDDTGTSGGAIALTTQVDFTPVLADGALGVDSDDAGDTTQSMTITGRVPSGAIETDVIALNGTTRVAGVKVFTTILRMELDGATAGDITVDRNTDSFVVKVIPAGVTLVTRTFYDSKSEALATDRYEKVFGKNEHGSLALTVAQIKLTQDPSAKIMIGLTVAKDDSTSVANRKTAPGGVSFVDDNVAINVPGGNLEAGAAIGVWVHQALGIGDPPFKSTYTLELSGQTAA